MGQPRILGRNAKLFLKAPDGSANFFIGEIDSFSAKNNDEAKPSMPIGESEETTCVIFEGYDLEFNGGKVNWHLANLTYEIDKHSILGKRSPYFQVVHRLDYQDGTIEEWVYQNVTIHGYNFDAGGSGDELKEKISAFAGWRDVGPNTNKVALSDTTTLFDAIKNIVKGLTQ